jgi:hypothetical protein
MWSEIRPLRMEAYFHESCWVAVRENYAISGLLIKKCKGCKTCTQCQLVLYLSNSPPHDLRQRNGGSQSDADECWSWGVHPFLQIRSFFRFSALLVLLQFERTEPRTSGPRNFMISLKSFLVHRKGLSFISVNTRLESVVWFCLGILVESCPSSVSLVCCPFFCISVLVPFLFFVFLDVGPFFPFQ